MKSYIVTISKLSLALFFWTYLISKIFIFDIDILLLKAIDPGLLSYLKFKFFFFMGSVTLGWIFLDKKTFRNLILYSLFFPFILFFWILPRFLYRQKSWNLLIGVIDGVTSMYGSFKYNFIFNTLFLISFFTTLWSSDRLVLATSSIFLLVLIFSAYVRRIYLVFKPTNLFSFARSVFSKTILSTKETFNLQKDLQLIERSEMNPFQLKSWTECLQSTVFFNQVLIFAARKLRVYQKSGFNIVAYMALIFFLILMTVLGFCAVNIAVFKIQPEAFGYSVLPTFFTFFYYSFNNLVFNSINEITPISSYSQTILMLEQVTVFFLLANVGSLFFSFRSQRYEDELNDIIKDIEKESSKLETRILEDFNLATIDDAVEELVKLKSTSAELIKAISKGNKSNI